MPAGSAPTGAPAAHGHQHQPYAGHPYAPQAGAPQGYAPGPGMPGPQTAVGPGAVPQGPVQHAPVPPPPVPPPASEVPEVTQSGTSALDFTYAEPPEGFAEAVRSARAEREAEEEAARQQPTPGEHATGDQSTGDQPSHGAPSAASPDEIVPDETQVPALRGLLLENGETVNVLGGGYIGRAPRSPDEDADAQLVAVPDPERSLSRTHARFGLVGGDLWLEDLGSANGTTVQMADGRQAHLTPHQRVALPVGTVVLLGTRRVTVTEGSDHTS